MDADVPPSDGQKVGIHLGNDLGSPEPGGLAGVDLAFRGAATRPLVAFGADLRVLWPEEVRAELATVAAAAALTHGS
jgi:hypothetical protein